MTINMKQAALEYHSKGRKGKIEVVPTKPCKTQWDLSLAYTPGVAEPCREIERDPDLAYEYTNKGNLVAVVTNGTAVLGLGDIGSLAGKPVMEGKSVLFKRFADIDAFDIEQELKRQLSIPVFHDDQHGTAIISGAGLMNACEITGKELSKVKMVFSGAGAAAISCAEFFILLGAKRENIIMCDSRGVIYKGREQGMTPQKERLSVDTRVRTLAESMKGADVFVGLSVAGMVTKEMVKSMAKRPIIFAMANPDPEISYPDAKSVRSDLIMATGRSDYPNQVNNVLGFPFIFRGALDVRARSINEEMKVAASYALARLAKQGADESVAKAYGESHFEFGPEYIVPKPFDPRVFVWESVAVAQAAMQTGSAKVEIDIEEYREKLERWVAGKSSKARRHTKRKVANR